MTTKFSGLKGMRDFYPDELAELRFIFKNLTEVSERFGFQEYEAPIMESLDLYMAKSGEEIAGQLYCFKDKGNRDVALRPEMTPTLARMVSARMKNFVLPIRWFSIPRCFRYERPQKGRLREFFQWNLDIVGEDSVFAELEVISCAAEALYKLGLGESDFQIRISSRSLLEAILKSTGLSPDTFPAICKILDKMNKLSREVFEKLLSEQLEEKQLKVLFNFLNAKTLEEINENEENSLALGNLKQLFDLLKENPFTQNNFVFAPDIVRGLDYYTGIVFEFFDLGENKRAVCGGGRYDSLLKDLGGAECSSVGLGMGDVIVHDMLKSRELLKNMDYKRPSLVFCLDKEALPIGAKLSALLRKQGQNVIFHSKAAKIKKAFKLTENYKVRTLFLLNQDAQKGLVSVRDADSKEEKQISIQSLEEA